LGRIIPNISGGNRQRVCASHVLELSSAEVNSGLETRRYPKGDLQMQIKGAHNIFLNWAREHTSLDCNGLSKLENGTDFKKFRNRAMFSSPGWLTNCVAFGICLNHSEPHFIHREN